MVKNTSSGLSTLSIVMATIVASSLLFLATRINSIRVRQEALTAMRNDALSGGVAELDSEPQPDSPSQPYAGYFISMP